MGEILGFWERIEEWVEDLDGRLREGVLTRGEESDGEEETLEKTTKNAGIQFFMCDHFFVLFLEE